MMICLLPLVFFLSACGGSGSPPTSQNVGITAAEIKSEFVRQVNGNRPVAFQRSSILDGVAQRMAEDSAAHHKRFTGTDSDLHIDSNGNDPRQRLRDAGYPAVGNWGWEDACTVPANLSLFDTANWARLMMANASGGPQSSEWQLLGVGVAQLGNGDWNVIAEFAVNQR